MKESLAEWGAEGKVRKLWARDASLWSGQGAQWLGWLGITNDQLAHIERLTAIREAAKSAGFSHVLLLGMGGSSLGPEVIKTTFGTISGFPELYVLDSTDPAQVKAFENKVDLRNTLFIVSSKSGSTLEPNVFKQYFFDRIARLVGPKEAGRRFLAITDPGSKMQQVAERDGFRRIFLGWPNIGGRYRFSPISGWSRGHHGRGCGEVPGPDRADGVCLHAVRSCRRKSRRHARHDPRRGGARIRPRQNDDRGITADLEYRRLVGAAGGESTGKEGKGLIPIDREPLGKPDVYGRDRLLVHLRLSTAADTAQDAAVDELERAGHPVIALR